MDFVQGPLIKNLWPSSLLTKHKNQNIFCPMWIKKMYSEFHTSSNKSKKSALVGFGETEVNKGLNEGE